MKDKSVVTCVYCGHEYQEGTPTSKHKLLTDHIKVCEKHPMREAEEKIRKLRKALWDLVGADDDQNLKDMRVVTSELPEELFGDKQILLNAIDALLDTRG